MRKKFLTFLNRDRLEILGQLKSHPNQALVSRRQEGAYLLRQSEAQGQLRYPRIFERPVPAFRVFAELSRAPWRLRERLDRQTRNSTGPRLLYNLRPEVSSRVADEIDRKDDGIKSKEVQKGQRDRYRVRRKTQKSDQSLVPGAQDSLRCPARSEDSAHVFRFVDSMKLEKVDVAGAQPAERSLEVEACLVRGSFERLACEEYGVPMRSERGTKHRFG